MNGDFNYFVDCLVLEAANRQTDQRLKWLDFEELCGGVQTECPPTWISMARERIISQDFGKFGVDTNRVGRSIMKINSNGIARASVVRVARKKPTVSERIKGIPRSDWIAFLALVASIVALFK